MRHGLLAIFSFILTASFTGRSHQVIATVNIQQMTIPDLESLKNSSALTWWSEFGDTLVLGGTYSKLQSAGIKMESVWNHLPPENLEVVIAGHRNELPTGTKIIAQSGRMLLVRKSTEIVADHHIKVVNFEKNKVYVRSALHDPAPLNLTESQKQTALSIMEEVDAVRWFSDVAALTNWNRHISSVDIVSARDWFKSQFESLAAESVSLQKFTVSGRDAWNVIATFNESDANDVYIIGGHYDSISEQISKAAPGAEDNATGSAGVLELARIFANKKTNATMIFIVFSGEEQGLWGSKAFVRGLPTNFRNRIKAVINMDMIGYSIDDSEDVLLETSRDFKNLTDQFAAASSLVPGLRYFTTFNPFGSDHMPFIDNNIPAILTIDNDWNSYPAYHRTTDTIDKISREMGAAILKMNAAALAIMTGVETSS